MLIAIYSRKSRWTGRGDSVENQVLMCREYIAGHIEDGENAEILVYEDEGFFRKRYQTPRFQKMLADMQARHFPIWCAITWAVWAEILQIWHFFNGKAEPGTDRLCPVSKNSFDTTSPMGKAMLYFAGVLAQMEREQIARGR